MHVLFRNLIACLASVFAIASFSASVFAEETKVQRGGQPYYGGVDVFYTQSDMVPERDIVFRTNFILDRDNTGTLDTQREISFDDAGHGKRIYMGVSSAEDWDWEWGYIDFGKTRGQYAGPFSNGNLVMRTDAKAEGWFLHVQFSPEIYANVEANLKLGVLRWDGSKFSRLTRYDRTTGVPLGAPSDFYETVAGIDEYYGVGLIFNVNERWKIRTDLNRYNLGEEEIDTIGVAAQFWFSGRLINNIFDY